MSKPIEDYALIGDGHTVALVARDGAIDWLCWPRFDSDACLSALLGAEEHGTWRIAPASPAAVMRRYGGGDLGLRTELVAAGGRLVLTDFMPIRQGRSSAIVRRLEVLAGTVEVEVMLRLRFGFGEMSPWWEHRQQEHAVRIAERIMRPDMFSGWGIRTLSSDHPRFGPLAYQQGSVWPFDTLLIVAGLRRYGLDQAAAQLVGATVDAAAFRLHRLPEFIAGTQRRPGDELVHTPRADPMQAWSAGALPFMLTALLGLKIDGFDRRVTVRRPTLPPGVQRLRLAALECGADRITLDIATGDDQRTTVALSGASFPLCHDNAPQGACTAPWWMGSLDRPARSRMPYAAVAVSPHGNAVPSSTAGTAPTQR